LFYLLQFEAGKQYRIKTISPSSRHAIHLVNARAIMVTGSRIELASGGDPGKTIWQRVAGPFASSAAASASGRRLRPGKGSLMDLVVVILASWLRGCVNGVYLASTRSDGLREDNATCVSKSQS